MVCLFTNAAELDRKDYPKDERKSTYFQIYCNRAVIQCFDYILKRKFLNYTQRKNTLTLEKIFLKSSKIKIFIRGIFQ